MQGKVLKFTCQKKEGKINGVNIVLIELMQVYKIPKTRTVKSLYHLLFSLCADGMKMLNA